MSDLTPPKFWKTQGQADYWLGRFIEETNGQLKYQDLFRLAPLVFDKVRVGWETRVVLKKEFVDDPDALAWFVQHERLPRQVREMYRRISEEREAEDEA